MIVDTYFSKTADQWFFTIVFQNADGANSTQTCNVPPDMIQDMQHLGSGVA